MSKLNTNESKIRLVRYSSMPAVFNVLVHYFSSWKLYPSNIFQIHPSDLNHLPEQQQLQKHLSLSKHHPTSVALLLLGLKRLNPGALHTADVSPRPKPRSLLMGCYTKYPHRLLKLDLESKSGLNENIIDSLVKSSVNETDPVQQKKEEGVSLGRF